MSIRACIATFEYPPTVGGVAVSAHRVAKLLRRSGHSMHVAVPEYVSADTELTGRGLRIATALEDDVWVHRICIPQRTRSWKDRDIEVDFYVALTQLHNTYSFQLLHSFYLRTPARACTFFAAERNLPYVASARGGDLYRQVFAPGG